MKKTVIISTIFALIVGLLIIGSSKLSHLINSNENDELYAYVPEEANLILQVNTKNLIKEGAYRALFYSDELPFLDSIKTEDNEFNFGINLEISPIIFTETWENKVAWFGVFALNDESNFTTKLSKIKEKGGVVDFSSNSKLGAICLRYDGNPEVIKGHLQNITQENINDINDKIDLKTAFKTTSVLNGLINNFNLSEQDYLENIYFELSNKKGSTVILNTHSENHLEDLAQYENQSFLSPKGFHISARIPKDLSISFLEDSSSIPNIEYLSLNYGGFNMNGFSGGELDLELFLKTNPQAFKLFLNEKIAHNNGSIQANATMDTLSIVGTILRVQYKENGVCLLGLNNTPVYETNEKALFLKTNGALSNISKVEGNVGVIQLLLQSLFKINLRKTHHFLESFEESKGEIYMTEQGLSGEIRINTKPGKDFFIEGLKMIK